MGHWGSAESIKIKNRGWNLDFRKEKKKPLRDRSASQQGDQPTTSEVDISL